MALALVQDNDARVTTKPSTGLKNVWARNLHILQLSAAGVKDVDIAAQLGVTSATVRNTLRSPLINALASVALENSLQEALDVRRRLATIAPLAVQFMQSTLEDPEAPGSLKHRVAADVLDRAGYPKQVTVNTGGSLFDAETINRLKQVGERIRHKVTLSVETEQTTFNNGTQLSGNSEPSRADMVHVGDAVVLSD